MIEAGLKQYLAADPTVSTIVGNKIYAVLMKKGVPFPAVVYTVVATVPVFSLDGDNRMESKRFQFDSYAEDYLTSRNLSRAIRSLLVPKSDLSGTAQNISYTLPDGTFVGGAIVHEDHDLPFEVGEGGYIFRALLDVQLFFNPAP